MKLIEQLTEKLTEKTVRQIANSERGRAHQKRLTVKSNGRRALIETPWWRLLSETYSEFGAIWQRSGSPRILVGMILESNRTILPFEAATDWDLLRDSQKWNTNQRYNREIRMKKLSLKWISLSVNDDQYGQMFSFWTKLLTSNFENYWASEIHDINQWLMIVFAKWWPSDAVEPSWSVQMIALAAEWWIVSECCSLNSIDDGTACRAVKRYEEHRRRWEHGRHEEEQKRSSKIMLVT